MSLTKKDKENLLELINRCETIEDLKLALSTLVILEDFAKEKKK
jgi:hypothetical protein